MRAERANWAATVPWNGIQDKPAWAGRIVLTISDIEGLQAALDALENQADAPTFDPATLGSAAYVDIGYFQRAWNARTLQVGEAAILLGVQEYAVTFTETMSAVPRVVLQHFMVDSTGEQFYASVLDDSLTADGFTIRLSGVPVGDGGRVEWTAKVETQP